MKILILYLLFRCPCFVVIMTNDNLHFQCYESSKYVLHSWWGTIVKVKIVELEMHAHSTHTTS